VNNDAFFAQMRASIDKLVAADMEWLRHDRHGRWVVLEPGVGRLLKDSPPHVRDYVDAVTDRRARRFSSLSRARKFARKIDGVVRRWRRRPPSRMGLRRVWRREGVWEHARRSTNAMFMLPGMRHAIQKDA
jgi:hypothetical protein